MDNVEKRLNIKAVTDRMLERGLSQKDLADKLQVTGAAISSWFKPEKFPRPQHLLKLAELLELTFQEIVLKSRDETSRVAFRKSGNYKITKDHVEKFDYVSRLLKKLVPHLPFDTLTAPPVLKDPKVDYAYIQQAAAAVRASIETKGGVIEFDELLKFFNALQAVLVPVLWGEKHYKNATHVFLPDSSTTWIFINLDTKVFDFKFWLAHELGHAKTPQLTEEEGEAFADSFAGALLFPENLAKEAFENLVKISDEWQRVSFVCELAKKFIISPLTIYYEVNAFARHHGLEPIAMEKTIFRGSTQFNKGFKLLSEGIFNTQSPEPKDVIKFAEEELKTPFFDCLAKFLSSAKESPKFVSNLLDISLEDGYALYKELV